MKTLFRTPFLDSSKRSDASCEVWAYDAPTAYEFLVGQYFGKILIGIQRDYGFNVEQMKLLSFLLSHEGRGEDWPLNRLMKTSMNSKQRDFLFGLTHSETWKFEDVLLDA